MMEPTTPPSDDNFQADRQRLAYLLGRLLADRWIREHKPHQRTAVPNDKNPTSAFPEELDDGTNDSVV